MRMSSVERAIYNTALGDNVEMFQHCNHAQVSERYHRLLGGAKSIVPLDKIHASMVSYHKAKVASLTKRLHRQCQQLDRRGGEDDPELTDLISVTREHIATNQARLSIFDRLEERIKEEKFCAVCTNDLRTSISGVFVCGHFLCSTCVLRIRDATGKGRTRCPICCCSMPSASVQFADMEKTQNTNKWGTKISAVIDLVKRTLVHSQKRIVVFSQWMNMLKMLQHALSSSGVESVVLGGNYHTMHSKLRRFKLSHTHRVILLSSERASSGLNLTEASDVILVDTLHTDPNQCQIIEEQAIGRAVRIGQTKEVVVTRLFMKGTIEETMQNAYTNKIGHRSAEEAAVAVLVQRLGLRNTSVGRGILSYL